MKILYIPSWYPSKGLPGSGSFFKEEALELSKHHNVTVLDITNVGLKDYLDFSSFKISDSISLNLRVIEFKSPDFGSFNNDFFAKKYAIFKLKLLMKVLKIQFDFDVIHCASYLPAGYIGEYLSNLYNIPFIIVEHSSRMLRDNFKSHEILELTRLIRRSDGFYAVSTNLKKHLAYQLQLKDTIGIIPNMYSDIFKYKQPATNNFSFICIASLIKSKNVDVVIKGFKSIENKFPKIKLVIIGDGPERKKLEKLSCNSNIEFTGQLGRNEVYEEITKSNCLISASSYETFGIVFLEALAVGRPIISFDNGGIADIINEHNGILIHDVSENTIQTAMIKMIENYRNFNFEFFSREILEKFGSERHIRILNSIYSSIINKHRTSVIFQD